MKFKPHNKLPYLHGKPDITGDLRTTPADFKVFELLPFSPSGEGEHLLLFIEKTGVNTVFVARQLAKFFGVRDMHVTYAGLKDKNAVTQQWFGIHLPGNKPVDISELNIDGVTVLSSSRHNKKLKTGALIGNRFELILRNVSHVDDAITRFEQVTKTGAPNYFGEQRFGFNGSNLDRALALFGGQKVKDKKKRGMYLSSARSYLFNQVIGARINSEQFSSPVEGDVFMLSGTQSIFKWDADDTDIQARLLSHDIDITAPMWGKGELLTALEAKALEQQSVSNYQALCQGLESHGLKQERRRIRLTPLQPKAKKLDEQTCLLSFILPAGSYATAILREVINYTDVSEHQGTN